MAIILTENINKKTQKYADGSTSLHFAAATGDLNLAREMISLGMDVNIINDSGYTAFNVAFRFGHLNLIKYLLECGADFTIDWNGEGFSSIHLAKIAENNDSLKYFLEIGKNKENKNYIDPSNFASIRMTLYKRGAMCLDNLTVFHAAASTGEFEYVQKMISREVNINVPDKFGNTAVHLAAHHNHLDILKYLISLGADFKNNFNSDGHTPIHLSTINEHFQCVEYLIISGADVNVKDRDGKTPSHLAAYHGKIKTLKFLLKWGADFSMKYNDDESILHLAATHPVGGEECLSYLIENGLDVNVLDKDGFTPIFAATRRGRLNIIKHLIYLGADLKVNPFGETLLHTAAYGGSTECVKYLIECGFHINLKDKLGHSPIIYAIHDNNIEMIEFLESLGADISDCCLNDATPFHHAVAEGSKDIVIYFINKGYNENLLDSNDKHVIHYAAQNGQLSMMQFFMDRGANLGAVTKNNHTALSYAAHKGADDCVRFLFNMGACVNFTNTEFVKAFISAAINGHVHILKLLMDYRPDILKNRRNIHFITKYATWGKNKECIDYMKEIENEYNNERFSCLSFFKFLK